jgi:hypothetical protein
MQPVKSEFRYIDQQFFILEKHQGILATREIQNPARIRDVEFNIIQAKNNLLIIQIKELLILFEM